jgi:hypothetical protein
VPLDQVEPLLRHSCLPSEGPFSGFFGTLFGTPGPFSEGLENTKAL